MSNYVLRISIWVLGSISLFGNTVVIIWRLKDSRDSKVAFFRSRKITCTVLARYSKSDIHRRLWGCKGQKTASAWIVFAGAFVSDHEPGTWRFADGGVFDDHSLRGLLLQRRLQHLWQVLEIVHTVPVCWLFVHIFFRTLRANFDRYIIARFHLFPFRENYQIKTFESMK